jgi:hypothetical protein
MQLNIQLVQDLNTDWNVGIMQCEVDKNNGFLTFFHEILEQIYPSVSHNNEEFLNILATAPKQRPMRQYLILLQSFVKLP